MQIVLRGACFGESENQVGAAAAGSGGRPRAHAGGIEAEASA